MFLFLAHPLVPFSLLVVDLSTEERIPGGMEDVDVRSSLLETNGASSSTELPKDDALWKRDSYANFDVPSCVNACFLSDECEK